MADEFPRHRHRKVKLSLVAGIFLLDTVCSFFCPDKVCNSIREGVTVPRSHKKWSRAPRFFLFRSNLFSRSQREYVLVWFIIKILLLLAEFYVYIISWLWVHLDEWWKCKPWIGKWLIQYLIVVIRWFSVRARHASSRRFTTIWEGFVQTWS